MGKRKVLLASIVTASALFMVGCSGGGSGSSVAGVISNASAPAATAVSSIPPATWNESTDLRVGGVPFYEATYSATSATPPGVPVVTR